MVAEAKEDAQKLVNETHWGIIIIKDDSQKTVKVLNHFLDYCTTHPETVVLYWASDMILHNQSDTVYLVATLARSRAAG